MVATTTAAHRNAPGSGMPGWGAGRADLLSALTHEMAWLLATPTDAATSFVLVCCPVSASTKEVRNWVRARQLFPHHPYAVVQATIIFERVLRYVQDLAIASQSLTKVLMMLKLWKECHSDVHYTGC